MRSVTDNRACRRFAITADCFTVDAAVSAVASLQIIIAIAAVYLVIAAVTVEVVITITATDMIDAISTLDFIISCFTAECVVTVFSLDNVISTASTDDIVAVIAVNFIVTGGPHDHVIAICSCDISGIRIAVIISSHDHTIENVDCRSVSLA